MKPSSFESKAELEATVSDLATVDTSLASIIDEIGFPEYPTRTDGFRAIARIVIGQQISVRAAGSIYDGLRRSLAQKPFAPRHFLELNSHELSSSGLSKSKSRCLTELGSYLIDHPDYFADLKKMPDHIVEERLTEFWGVGRWTAQIYMIFCLKRRNIFPIADGSLQRAIRDIYSLTDIDSIEMRERLQLWDPKKTAVALLLWKWLDHQKKEVLAARQ